MNDTVKKVLIWSVIAYVGYLVIGTQWLKGQAKKRVEQRNSVMDELFKTI